jgi:hypothetical protein
MWSIILLLVLLSPVIAFLLALAADIAVCALVDAGAGAVIVLGAGAAAAFLLRRLGLSRRANPNAM